MRAVSGTNLEQAHSHNRRVVIDTVRSFGPITRSAIARRTALATQTVSNIVEELEQKRILVAGAAQKAARGLPVVPYSINPDGAYAIGFELTRFRAAALLTDLAGVPRARAERGLDDAAPATAMPAFAALAAELLEPRRFERASLLGAGLALPGRYSASGAMSLSPLALPGWEHFPVASALEDLIGIPALVENDATAAAIGEKLFGAANGLHSFVYLYLGGGVGAGLILNGHRYRGSRNNAGEIGHIVMVPDGRPCRCGKAGCLDRYLSLESVFDALGIEYPNRLGDADVEALASRPNPAVERWIERAADPLRRLIDMLERAFDPQTIVLGGPMPRSLVQRLISRIMPLPEPVDADRARIMPRVLLGAITADTPLRGAAALPIFAETNPQFDALQKRVAS